MAVSKCPKCEGTTFELKETDKVRGTHFPICFIQCITCGTVVGVTDTHNVPDLILKLANALKIQL